MNPPGKVAKEKKGLMEGKELGAMRERETGREREKERVIGCIPLAARLDKSVYYFCKYTEALCQFKKPIGHEHFRFHR